MIKSILNKWFTKNEPLKKENHIPNSNAVLFWIGEDGLPYVKIYIVDTDTTSSRRFGDMLFSINTGQYMDYTLSVLVDISRQDSQVNEYIKNVISYWKNLLDTQDLSIDIENEPHIRPTAFNHIVQNDRT